MTIIQYEVFKQGRRATIEKLELVNDDCIKLSAIELIRNQLQAKYKKAVTYSIHSVKE
jgi:hypothetical protein